MFEDELVNFTLWSGGKSIFSFRQSKTFSIGGALALVWFNTCSWFILYALLFACNSLWIIVFGHTFCDCILLVYYNVLTLLDLLEKNI